MVTDERANDAAKEIAKITGTARTATGYYLTVNAIAEIVQRAIDDAIDDRAQDADPSGG